MPTYNRYNKAQTKEQDLTKRRTIIASSVLALFVAALASTVLAVTLSAPNNRPEGPPVGGPDEDYVSTAVVFRSPINAFTSVLKDFSNQLEWNATMNRWESHRLMAIATTAGEPVLAVFGGTVTSVRNHTLFGRQVIVEHRDGLRTVYSNLDPNTQVTEGQRVEKGQQLGRVGTTSNVEFIDTPHLRFEVFSNDRRVNPNDWIDFQVK
ncbi:MAG: M23 family metallopeptidase [Firmicutes bacterium]|nr:M23 family metallopeptidase [Bacillota bacterium]